MPMAPRKLVDGAVWNAMQPAELVQAAAQLYPTGATATCVRYAAPDLCWAQPLSAEQLARWYKAPAVEFKAGMGFDNKWLWAELAGSNTEVWKWVVHGYSEYVPGFDTLPTIVRANNKNTGGKNESFVEAAVADLVGVGAVREVTHLQHDPSVVRAICPLTVAVQASGKQRLCWNGRPVNEYIPQNSFKMEHAEVAARMMRKGDYMMVLDMKAGYHQAPVKPEFRRLLCFAWQGKVYQWQVMPFGLSTAPRAYSKLARCLLKRWRAMGIRCSNYIDDFIFFAASVEEAERVRALVLRDLSDLGWYISPGKCMLQPGTMVEYLGLVFCSLPEPHVRVPHHKLQRAQALFQGALRKAAAVGPEGVAAGKVRTTGHTLAAALGFLQSLRLAVAVVPLFTRELYACLNTLPRVGERGYACFEYGSTVVLSEGALEECKFWRACTVRWNGFVVRPVAISRVIYTDGCGDGFGSMVHRVLNRLVEPADMAVAGSWELEASEDSVYTELEGLWRSVLAAGSALAGQAVLHRTDSISTYAVVRNGGSSRSPRLTAVVRRLLVYCMAFDITFASQYVGSGVIIRSGADLLSRSADVSDGCKLNPVLFAKLWRLWGPFTADMFASSATVQAAPGAAALPYWSMLADGFSAGVDALTARWNDGGVRYAFPPVKLVGDVVQLVLEQRARAVLVLPRWEAQWWWPVVLAHAVMPPVPLARIHAPNVEGPLFVQGRKGMLTHPLGKGFACPESVVWVAVLVHG